MLNRRATLCGGLKKHSITLSILDGGSASLSTDKAKKGETVYVYITYNEEDYAISSVTATNATVEGSGDTRYFIMPNNDVTVTVTFEYLWHKETVVIGKNESKDTLGSDFDFYYGYRSLSPKIGSVSPNALNLTRIDYYYKRDTYYAGNDNRTITNSKSFTLGNSNTRSNEEASINVATPRNGAIINNFYASATFMEGYYFRINGKIYDSSKNYSYFSGRVEGSGWNHELFTYIYDNVGKTIEIWWKKK